MLGDQGLDLGGIGNKQDTGLVGEPAEKTTHLTGREFTEDGLGCRPRPLAP
jgi:hypothetical protein